MKSSEIQFTPSPLGINKALSKSGMSGQGKDSFVEMLSKSVGEVNGLQKQSDLAGKELALGKTENIHDVMITMEKASVSFRLMAQVRNKMVEAYREVMRMQV